MNLHYSQTQASASCGLHRVSLPYEFTLFSNDIDYLSPNLVFHYLMNLHYSQTIIIHG